ncbi:hypothetical protein FPV67DRAFT_164595 [Lyophyllum atratum]|nr:hypothetical protein FPV67DRAFT_164595 [Lyophyllum atratum]
MGKPASRKYIRVHAREPLQLFIACTTDITSLYAATLMSHSSTVVDQLPSVIDDAFRVLQTNYVGFASFTILIWDHIDTFDTEVEVIWKGKKGPIVYLFLLVRERKSLSWQY